MSVIHVISAGPGAAEEMTFEARDALEKAKRVFTSERHAPLVDQKRLPLEPLDSALAQMETLLENGDSFAVLVSGDAGLYSLLPALTRRFGAQALKVYPGVSSIQVLSARLALPWQESRVLSGHGRSLTQSELAHEVRTHARTFLLCDGTHTPAWACRALLESGLETVEACAGEWLSYPREKIVRGSVEELSRLPFGPMSAAVFLNPQPLRGLPPPGMEDASFLRGQTPMTKREIRVLALSRLALQPDDLVWDIGAGTGSVSVECARQCPIGKVFAVERDETALELIQRNKAKFFVSNLELVQGSAPDALEGLPAPGKVFLGGGGGHLEAILDYLESLPDPFGLVAPAVTLESLRILTERLSSWKNLEAVQLAVTKLEEAGAYHLLRAQNPVFLISADWEGKA